MAGAAKESARPPSNAQRGMPLSVWRSSATAPRTRWSWHSSRVRSTRHVLPGRLRENCFETKITSSAEVIWVTRARTLLGASASSHTGLLNLLALRELAEERDLVPRAAHDGRDQRPLLPRGSASMERRLETVAASRGRCSASGCDTGGQRPTSRCDPSGNPSRPCVRPGDPRRASLLIPSRRTLFRAAHRGSRSALLT